MNMVDLLIQKEIKKANSIFDRIKKNNGFAGSVIPFDISFSGKTGGESIFENCGKPIELKLPFDNEIADIIQQEELHFRNLFVAAFTDKMDDPEKKQFLQIFPYNLHILSARLLTRSIREIANLLEPLGWLRSEDEYTDWMNKTEGLSLKCDIPDAIFHTAKNAYNAFQFFRSRSPSSPRYYKPIVSSYFAGSGVWDRYFLTQSSTQSEIAPFEITTDKNLLSCLRTGMNVLLQNLFIPENKQIKVFLIDSAEISYPFIDKLTGDNQEHPILCIRRCDIQEAFQADLNNALLPNVLNFDNSLVYLSEESIADIIKCLDKTIQKKNYEIDDLLILYTGLEPTNVKLIGWLISSQLFDPNLVENYEKAVENVAEYNGYKAAFVSKKQWLSLKSGEKKELSIIEQVRSPTMARLFNIIRNYKKDPEACRIFLALLQINTRLSDLLPVLRTETQQHHEWLLQSLKSLSTNINIDEIMIPGSNRIPEDGVQILRAGALRVSAQ